MVRVVVFHLSTGYAGEDQILCYQLDEFDENPDYLEEYGRQLAMDNFEEFGHSEDDGDEWEMHYEIREGHMTDFVEEYGEVSKL